MKCETHNHPTAISLFGRGDRLGRRDRDEGRPDARETQGGTVRFSVSHLRIPDFEQAWEKSYGKPERVAWRCRSCSRDR